MGKSSMGLCYSRAMPGLARARKKKQLAADSRLPVAIPAIAGADVGYAQQLISGGDFLDLAVTPSGRLAMVLLDVCGKATQPVLGPAQQLFRSRSAELFTTGANDSEALTQLVLEINREILRIADGVRCTAAFFACFDPELGTLWYVNAGHTPAIVNESGGAAQQLAASGVPLGLFSHAVHDAQIYVLAAGAALALVSKGMVEQDGFGVEQAAAIVSARGTKPAVELCRQLLEAAESARLRHRLHLHRPQDQTAVALIRSAE
jgi:serine phosphatase RsbU (regulator of sigma subunit)